MAAEYSGSGVSNNIGTRIEMISSRMDEIVKKEAVTTAMNASEDIVRAFGKASSAKIATMTTSGLGDYDQVKGYPLGQVMIGWKEYTLRYDRGITIDIDRKEILQTDGLASTATAAANLMRLQVVPEVDATRLSQTVVKTKAAITDRAIGAEHVVEGEEVTKADILAKIGKGLDVIFDDRGIDSGMTIYMNSSLRSVLRESTEYTKTKPIAGARDIDLSTSTIDGNRIVWVPKDRMYSEYTYNNPAADGTGGGISKKAATTTSINFLIVAPGCSQGVTVISEPKFIDKDVNQRKDADSLMYRLFHDVIVEQNSGASGIYASVGKPPSSL